jgi:hypothetical protein
MSETTGAAVAAAENRLPYGGSKWRAGFGLPRQAVIRRVETRLIPNGFCTPEGTVGATSPELEASEPYETIAETAFPLRAGPDVALGQFLTGALPGILAQRGDWEGGVLAGAALTPAQSEVLARLGLLAGYVTLAKTVKFRLVVSQAEVPAHHAPADADTLAMLARLRGGTGGDGRVAILPDRETERMTLRNRASLTAWLRAKRITVLDVPAMGLAGVASALGTAGLVVIADPAQAGLAGLCAPGTNIVEIVPEGFAGTAMRAICDACAAPWSLLFGSAPVYPLSHPLAFGARVMMSYEIPIGALNKLLGALGG